jgi:hypothetical protein
MVFFKVLWWCGWNRGGLMACRLSSVRHDDWSRTTGVEVTEGA